MKNYWELTKLLPQTPCTVFLGHPVYSTLILGVFPSHWIARVGVSPSINLKTLNTDTLCSSSFQVQSKTFILSFIRHLGLALAVQHDCNCPSSAVWSHLIWLYLCYTNYYDDDDNNNYFLFLLLLWLLLSPAVKLFSKYSILCHHGLWRSWTDGCTDWRRNTDRRHTVT